MPPHVMQIVIISSFSPKMEHIAGCYIITPSFLTTLRVDLGCPVSVSLNLPVQKDEWLLAEHNEYRVAQLRQFAEHEEPGPEAAHAILLDVAVGEGWEYRSVIVDLHMAIKFPAAQAGHADRQALEPVDARPMGSSIPTWARRRSGRVRSDAARESAPAPFGQHPWCWTWPARCSIWSAGRAIGICNKKKKNKKERKL